MAELASRSGTNASGGLHWFPHEKDVHLAMQQVMKTLFVESGRIPDRQLGSVSAHLSADRHQFRMHISTTDAWPDRGGRDPVARMVRAFNEALASPMQGSVASVRIDDLQALHRALQPHAHVLPVVHLDTSGAGDAALDNPHLHQARVCLSAALTLPGAVLCRGPSCDFSGEQFRAAQGIRQTRLEQELELVAGDGLARALGMSDSAMPYLKQLGSAAEVDRAIAQLEVVRDYGSARRFVREHLHAALDNLPPGEDKPILVLLGETHDAPLVCAMTKAIVEALQERFPARQRAFLLEAVETEYEAMQKALPSYERGALRGVEPETAVWFETEKAVRTGGFEVALLEQAGERPMIDERFGANARLLAEMAWAAEASGIPSVRQRDGHMSRRIEEHPFQVGFGVVGAYHLPGVHDRLKDRFTVVAMAAFVADGAPQSPVLCARNSYVLSHPDIRCATDGMGPLTMNRVREIFGPNRPAASGA